MPTHKTTIEFVQGSVLDQDVDAIVNAANTAMRGGGGIDGAIHKAAGRQLMNELIRVAPHGAKAGTAVITKGYALKQPYVIHTPGPVWHGGKSGEPDLLASSYRSCLEQADKKQLKSLAFCSISTGIYGYPLDLAAPLALQTVMEYLNEHLDTSLERIVFAMFKPEEFAAFTQAWDALLRETALLEASDAGGEG
ncbi:MAG: macro domain-containing protein [Armatimonadota bacterium]|nr:macro domain-containing protein [Armatimonadota bacterium]